MNEWYTSTLLLLTFSTLGIICGQVTLTPGTVVVDENNPVTLTCTYTGTGTVQLFSWSEVVGDVGGDDDISRGKIIPSSCAPFGTPVPDNTKYTYSCTSNKQMTWTIKNVDRTNDGDRWACIATVPNSLNSNAASISVQVPITSVSMTIPNSDATLNVEENTEQMFRCRTDGGLPVADISWYKDNGTPGTSDDIKIRQNITTTQPTDNGLYIRTSTLKLYPSRSDTNNSIYCSAKNSDGQTPWISTRQPKLNVQYGPDGPPTIEGYNNGGTYQVTENQTTSLKCSSTGGNPLATLSWSCYNGQTTSDGTTSTTVVSTRTWTAVRNTDRTCTCTSTHTVTGQQTTVPVNVQVLYPTSTPTFTVNSNPVSGTVKVIRGKTLRIQCVSSGQPTPTYTWTYPDNTIHNGQQLELGNIQTSSNGQYTCKAENHPYRPSSTTPASASSQVTVQVLFAPSTPTIYYNTITGSPITVDPFDIVAGDSLPVACKSDGQPEPNYTWQFNNNQLTGQTVVLSSIDRDIVDTSIKCIARNELKETGSTTAEPKSSTSTVTMNILYPPDKPNIRLKQGSGTYTSISDTFSVIEGAAFVLDCQGSSKPNPSYRWLGSGTQNSSEFHIPADTTTRDGIYVYMCEVTNLMTRTYSSPSTQEGKNSTNITANVLYGPVVLPMSNQSAEEGKSFRYTCPYTPGNPAVTTVKWTSDDGNKIQNTEMLDIDNVSKNDKMKYICTVENTMKPTNLAPVTDPKSGYFYLDVKYKASIETFTVKEQNNEVTVDEFTSPTLACSVDSNPDSNIKVLYRDQTLAEVSSTLQLTHQLSNVSCGDIGVYTCEGRNYLNTQTPSTQDVVLLVMCRPQPYGDIAYIVYSAQRNTVTLHMSVLAYPVSPSVIWKKDEIELKNNSKLTMTVNHVESTETYIDIIQLDLTVHNVTISDFGQYDVQISNDVGMMEKTFYLKAEDIPETPTEFELISGLTKTTEATIQWKPEFNGGPNQTFVLLYKKQSDMEWNTIYVNETGEEMMKYTLDNLESNTVYVVKIYALNRVGNSSISKDVTIRTLEIEDSPGGNIGMIVGGAVGGIVFAGLVAFAVVFLLRRRRGGGGGGDKKKLNRRTDSPPNDDDDSSEDIEIVENAAYISAGDVEQAKPKPEALYSMPVKNKKPVGGAIGGDIYAQVKKKDKKSEPKQKPKKGKGKPAAQGDIYENAPGPSNEKVYSNADANTYEETQIGKTPAKKNVNKDGLIYADLTFNDKDKGDKKLVIIGDDDRTPYAEVDFTKKADPLPDSDPE